MNAPIRKLGELTSLVSSGSTPKGGESVYLDDGPVMFIRSQNVHMNRLVLDDVAYISEAIDEAMGRTRVSPGDVLLNITGASIGRVAQFALRHARANVNQHVCIIRPLPEQLVPAYLTHFLASPSFQAEIDRQQVGGTRQALTFSQIRGFDIPLPSAREQRRIAAILDKADAIRRKRQETMALTEQLLRSTFLEVFGDPVTNPKRWPTVSMDDVIRETQYGTSAKANEEGRGLPVLRMNNLTSTGGLELSDLKWCEIEPKDLDAYTVKRGDVLFNRTNSPELVGKTAVWTLDEEYAFAGYLVRVRFDEARALPHYVSGFLNSDYGKRMLFAMQKTSNNMSNISATDLRRIRLPLPAIDQQRRYDSFVEAIVRSAPHRRRALSEADHLFNSLVQRAFSGQL